ncbi:MAG TPA: SpoIIE family protein phosphatase [Candidatus Limnocylindrales bacterium]|nr:SpoIIE family protein phosphatase [Candidatus Limnocylindrales bacterium]
MGIQVTDLNLIREQLLVRREKLEDKLARSHTANLVQLLEQVDKALEKLDVGSYGICESCQGEMGAQRILADPMARVCLDCLPPAEARALEKDLELAARIQAGLLPQADISSNGWKISHHYEPAGLVSGDYCDVMQHGNDLYFMLGDVSGKGVAASMLMANLHAMFRVLVPTGLPVSQLVERANRIFCESTLPTQYATLICGRAGQAGSVELCNGGHLAPLHVGQNGIQAIESSTVPVGLFCDQQFSSTHLDLAPGESLVLYTDGVTESAGPDGSEYGQQRLGTLLQRCFERGSRQMINDCLEDLLAFRASGQKFDDQTIMVLQFAPTQH